MNNYGKNIVLGLLKLTKIVPQYARNLKYSVLSYHKEAAERRALEQQPALYREAIVFLPSDRQAAARRGRE